MLESLLSMSPAAIVAVSVLLPVLVAAPFVLAVLGRAIPSLPDDNTVLAPTITFVGTSFSLLLAFVTVTVWSDQVDRQQIVNAEMAAIEDVLIECRTIAPDQAPLVKASALKYLDLMREREIFEDAPSGGDPEAERAFEESMRLVHDLVATFASDQVRLALAQGFIAETREWVRAREERVNTPPTQLDGILTGVLMMLALLTVVLVAILPATTTAWAKWVQTLAVAVTVGLTMSLVFYISSAAFTRDAEDQQIARVRQALLVTVTPPQVSIPSSPSPAAPR